MANYGIVIFALSTILVATVFSTSQEPDFDIKKFFNATEPIWTTNSTAGDWFPCKVDVKHSINETSATFYRAYIDRWRKKWRNKTLVGQFGFWTNSSEGAYDYMNIRTIEGPGAGEEVIHYQSADSQCAVFFVMGHVGVTISPSYDLRVKQSFLGRVRDTDCWKEFLNVTNGMKRKRLYHERCQKAFDINGDRILYS
uniref:Putative lipocalin-3 1 n=1 Tax=Amblyomma cajennense TaxID=34607 RepID=A0A023FTV1_AMBCJ